jgi:hypothetical protein
MKKAILMNEEYLRFCLDSPLILDLKIVIPEVAKDILSHV